MSFFAGVFALTALLNPFRMYKIRRVDQFIMAYGGLRGAVAYGLVITIDPNIVPAKNMFVTSVIVVIMFTVFVQVCVYVNLFSSDFFLGIIN